MLKETYVLESMLIDSEGNFVSDDSMFDLQNFSDSLKTQSTPHFTTLELLNENNLKMIKMVEDYSKDLNNGTKDFHIGTFVFPYELTEFKKYTESEDIKNIKMIMKWNIDNKKDIYFVSSVKFLVNESCVFSFIYDVDENSMIFESMDSESETCEPGIFLEDVMSIRDKLNINIGSNKIVFIEEDKGMPCDEEILYVDGDELVLHDRRIKISEMETRYKLFNLKDPIENKAYNKLLNKLYLTLNKKVLNKLLNNYNKELEGKVEKLNTMKKNDLYKEMLIIMNKSDKKDKKTLTF